MEQKDIDRFHSKYIIDADSNCWNWTGAAHSEDGYGRIWVDGKFYLAHRFSAMIHGLDMSGEVMRHLCNNSMCVNPAHLQTGSHQDNTNDKIKAGRQSKRSKSLSDYQVSLIKKQYKFGSTIKDIAIRFGKSKDTIRRIISGTY